MDLLSIIQNLPFLVIYLLYSPANNHIMTPKEEFLEYYENNWNLLAENICDKAKNLSENLLKNENIFNATSSSTSRNTLKDFQIFLQEFLQDYTHVKRYKISERLLAIFMQVLNKKYYGDHKYKEFQQIIKLYFAQIIKEYEISYRNFIKLEFLPKLEILKQNFSAFEMQRLNRTKRITDYVVNCMDFKCFPKYHYLLAIALNVNHDTNAKYKKLIVKNSLIYLIMDIYEIGKLILKDKQMQQLCLDCRHNIENKINYFLLHYDINNDIETFIKSFNFEQFILLKNDHNNIEFAKKDRELLSDIFEKYVADNVYAKKSKYLLAKYDMFEELVNSFENLNFYTIDRIISKYEKYL